jgi:hypothetical protein
LAEQRRVIEFLLRQVTSPDFPHVEEVRQVLTAGKPAACLPGGWELLLDRVSGELIMRRLAGQPT